MARWAGGLHRARQASQCSRQLSTRSWCAHLGSPDSFATLVKVRAQQMAQGPACARALLAALMVAIVATHFTAHAQPPTADHSIAKDRTFRQSAVKVGRTNMATTPKFGFFGTIFHLILEQINDTKSAYNQISDLVGNQFTDDNAVTVEPDLSNNGTTETPKISRAEFLKILDRNLKGLARLRSLEWREARKDSWANIGRYNEEIFGGKKPRNRR